MDRPSEADEDVMAGSVAQRLAIHGIKVEPAPGGVFVPLRQRLRGLIAPILDSQAVLPMLTTAERRYCFREDLPVGGTVPATLSLTLGTPARFGAFTPGVARDYDASTTANVISTAGDATLWVADPSADGPASWSTARSRWPSRCRRRPTPARSPPSAARRARRRC